MTALAEAFGVPVRDQCIERPGQLPGRASRGFGRCHPLPCVGGEPLRESDLKDYRAPVCPGSSDLAGPTRFPQLA